MLSYVSPQRGVKMNIFVPKLENMLSSKEIPNLSSYSCFPNSYDYYNKILINYLSRKINIAPNLISIYSEWLFINGKYYYFKQGQSFQELLMESIFKSIDVKTLQHSIIQYKGFIGLISENYRKIGKEYLNFNELLTPQELTDLSFIKINRRLRLQLSKKDYETYLITACKIIAIDTLFGQDDHGENNINFEKDSTNVRLVPMFDNESIFTEKYTDLIVNQSCFGIFIFSDKYEDDNTIDAFTQIPELLSGFEQALNINLDKIFKLMEIKYNLRICQELRNQIQTYYDSRRNTVEKTLKLVR